jgi:hypothetical protein
VHGQGVDFCWGEESDLGGFLAGPDLATDDPAGEADRKLLTDLTVVVGKDVPGV